MLFIYVANLCPLYLWCWEQPWINMNKWVIYYHGNVTGWWFQLSTPLKHFSQLGSLFPTYGEKKCSKPPTSMYNVFFYINDSKLSHEATRIDLPSSRWGTGTAAAPLGTTWRVRLPVPRWQQQRRRRSRNAAWKLSLVTGAMDKIYRKHGLFLGSSRFRCHQGWDFPDVTSAIRKNQTPPFVKRYHLAKGDWNRVESSIGTTKITLSDSRSAKMKKSPAT